MIVHLYVVMRLRPKGGIEMRKQVFAALAAILISTTMLLVVFCVIYRRLRDHT